MTEQTLGQKRVRASFNPSHDNLVDRIKAKTAELIDLCSGIGEPQSGVPTITQGDSEVARLKALAMTHYEDAAMWAVKAATTGK